MNRQEFMNRLAAELSKLPKEEIRAAMDYYSEYFDEAGPDREEETIRELGGPSKVATQIKADYAVRQLDSENGRQTTRKGLSAVLWVILGIFAAPVAFPVAIALGAVAFAVFVSIFIVIIALLASLIAFCAGGIALVGIGFAGLGGSIASGMMLIGMGLVAAGLTAVLCVGVVVGARALLRVTAKEMQRSSQRRRERKLAKEEGRHE